MENKNIFIEPGENSSYVKAELLNYLLSTYTPQELNLLVGDSPELSFSKADPFEAHVMLSLSLETKSEARRFVYRIYSEVFLARDQELKLCGVKDYDSYIEVHDNMPRLGIIIDDLEFVLESLGITPYHMLMDAFRDAQKLGVFFITSAEVNLEDLHLYGNVRETFKRIWTTPLERDLRETILRNDINYFTAFLHSLPRDVATARLLLDMVKQFPRNQPLYEVLFTDYNEFLGEIRAELIKLVIDNFETKEYATWSPWGRTREENEY